MSNLTPQEHQLVTDIGDLIKRFKNISGNEVPSDLSEVVLHVHALQNMVLSQSAARAYPSLYRLLGKRPQ